MKISLDISCESSDKQMIHMKCQDIFSENLKKKKNNKNVACNKFQALSGLILKNLLVKKFPGVRLILDFTVHTVCIKPSLFVVLLIL